MQPKRMAVQPKVKALQTALAGSQTTMRALQKGLLLDESTVQVGQRGHTVEKGALTPAPLPRVKPGASRRGGKCKTRHEGWDFFVSRCHRHPVGSMSAW